MNFHDVRFPARLSFGSVGGPERRTEIVSLSNGFEERNAPWAHSRRRYDAGIGVQSLDDLEKLVAFFEARKGQLIGFRWKDWTDYKSCRPSGVLSDLDQVIGTGDGQTRDFQLAKSYRSGSHVYVRPIAKPVEDTTIVALAGDRKIEGSDYELALGSGTIIFDTPPPVGAEITAGFEFDVPVRFDADRIETSVANFSAGEMPSIPVVEVRV
ncbi:DUF2460 domain-containing protein [Algicella marina]|uniref:TIGR02217 family protein n=1 Tax=Algicella marina TaxID=2683284 RepID=A0A6P1SY45_9RHOB|nr:DUF2460 domain-containing protein [Algicella marina]QHQ34560.1 TIGR02217 family protein [Algicella marina]